MFYEAHMNNSTDHDQNPPLLTPLITLVSSSPNLHNVLTSAIDTQHYELATAKTASESLDIIGDSKIALVDLILEDMDGLSLIEEFRARHKSLHIIAIMCKKELAAIEMSAESITLMASQAGANAVFIAPFNLAELLATIDRFLEASSQSSASITSIAS